METPAEVARLKDVYHRYAVAGLARSKWSSANRGNVALQGERDRKVRALLTQAGFFPLTHRHILEVGCGVGDELGRFHEWGANPELLHGVDLLPERIREARHRNPQIAFQMGNAESLAYEDEAFDLVVVFTVFTSILCRQMAG